MCHTKQCVLIRPFSFNYHYFFFFSKLHSKYLLWLIRCVLLQSCVFLQSCLNSWSHHLIHIPSLLNSSTKNLKFSLPTFSNSKYNVFIGYSLLPSILKKFLPSLILHCKKFAIYFSIRLKLWHHWERIIFKPL